jgi:hypothetical protein
VDTTLCVRFDGLPMCKGDGQGWLTTTTQFPRNLTFLVMKNRWLVRDSNRQGHSVYATYGNLQHRRNTTEHDRTVLQRRYRWYSIYLIPLTCIISILGTSGEMVNSESKHIKHDMGSPKLTSYRGTHPATILGGSDCSPRTYTIKPGCLDPVLDGEIYGIYGIYGISPMAGESIENHFLFI